MAGINTIVQYGCMSDEQRWNANRYNWEWLHELEQDDKDIAMLLDCLADGEYSGQASVAQTYDLMHKAKEKGYPKDFLNDWGEFLAYSNIIAYEETRHGLSVGLINHYACHGNLDYFDHLTVRDYSRKYIWCYEERRYWNLYSYALAHLFAEVVNTELYRDMRPQIKHPMFKEVITNIMKDEARHIRAWLNVIKNIVEADEYHKRCFLDALDCGLNYHNAMVHETYFEGQNKMMRFFVGSKNGEPGTIDRIISIKCKLLDTLFGEDNPYNFEKVKESHYAFLAKTRGKKRAVFSEEVEGNISFVD